MSWRRRLEGICRYARKAGWFVVPIEASGVHGTLHFTRKFWDADGFIVEDGVFGECGLKMGDFRGQTVVYCGRENYGGLWRVVHDSEDAAMCAVRELVSLGLKSYGYVGFRIPTTWSSCRERVFLREMSGNGVSTRVFDPCERGRITTAADFYKPLKAWLTEISKPCGILAANDEMGAHVLRAANELGIAVPDALSILGIDNDELICDYCTPPLASVSVPFEHAGWLAAQLLDRRLRKLLIKPETVVFGQSTVVPRPSLGRFAKRDAMVFRAIEFVRLNACGQIRVEDVTREMGVSRRSGEQRFKMTTGHSINDEILAVRLERAKTLLAEDKLPLDQIHVECGYKDGRSLRYMFRQATGMGLREWRTSHTS